MTTPSYRQPTSLGGGFTPPPKPIWILLAIQLVSLILDSFGATRPLISLLRLTPAVWQWGFVWQLATYPFVAFGEPSLWFLFSLLMLSWFGGDVYRGLGRRHFWRLLAAAVVGSALVAVATFFVVALAGWGDLLGPFSLGMGVPFFLMQGTGTLLTIFVAAFATANRFATVNLFLVLPVQARWLLGLEILIHLIRFLQMRPSKDLPGFLGSCAAVGIAYLYVSSGGNSRGFGQYGRKLNRWWSDLRLRFKRRRRGMKVVPGSGGGPAGVRKGPWVN